MNKVKIILKAIILIELIVMFVLLTICLIRGVL